VFQRLGSLTYRFRFAIVIAWIVGAAVAGLLAPSLAANGQTDQTSFLPAGTDALKARAALAAAFPQDASASSATITFLRPSGLTDADRTYMGALASWITGAASPAGLHDIVKSVSTAETRPELAAMLRSQDGQLEMLQVNLSVASIGPATDSAVDLLRVHLASTTPAGLQAHVTGAAGIAADYLTAIQHGTDSATLITIVLVVLILLLIYRAPLAALVPLLTIGAAFIVSRGVLGELAAAGWKISSLLDTFIVVLIFGVGTDYTIFLISRFREEVGRSGDWPTASTATVRRIGAVITASAATVIVGLGSMAFGDYGMIQTTGPALALAVAITLLAGLTLSPALLGIFGQYVFWPGHQQPGAVAGGEGFFADLATAVSRRPGLVTIVIVGALLIPAATVPQMHTNFDVLQELPATSDARIGFDDSAAHMGRGNVMPSTAIVKLGTGTDLLAPSSLARLRDVTRALASTPGVQTVSSAIAPTGDGAVPAAFQPSKTLASMAAGFPGTGGSTGQADPATLLATNVSSGLAAASAYVDQLGAAFPDVASGTTYTAVTADLTTAPQLLTQLRAAASVSTQLRELAAAIAAPGQSPTAVAAGLAVIDRYLGELVTAYPDTASLPAFLRAQADLVRLQQTQAPSAAADLVSAISALATGFDAHPDALLFPTSLPATPASTLLTEQVAATFSRLPADIQALSTEFASRPDDLFIPSALTGAAGTQVKQALAVFVAADGQATRLYLTTTDDPYSTSAFQAIRQARVTLADSTTGFAAGGQAYVGGPTAELADIQTTLANDFLRVALITILGVLGVLVLLLRALVAPLYLVLTVLLSYLCTLGLAAWFFGSVMGEAGLNYYLPLLVFVLLVALGSDYNIFMMSRVREESEHRPIREGVRIASGRTGAVITSAGLILAGTFGSMATAQLAVLVQVGVVVAAGVLLDTFVVRSILVPAITTLAGDRAWWPSRRGHGAQPVDRGTPAPTRTGAVAPR